MMNQLNQEKMNKKTKNQKETNVERFNRWMKEKVQSVYYSDNIRMCNAYERVLCYE